MGGSVAAGRYRPGAMPYSSSALGPLAYRDHGPPAPAVPMLESPGEPVAIDAHRPGHPRRKPTARPNSRQGLPLPGGDPRVEHIRPRALGREQEARAAPRTAPAARRVRATTFARPERATRRRERPRRNRRTSARSCRAPGPARAAAVEEEIVALVGRHAQAHAARDGPVEPQAVGRHERRLARTSAADPGRVPLSAPVPRRLLEEGWPRTTPRLRLGLPSCPARRRSTPSPPHRRRPGPGLREPAPYPERPPTP